MAKVMSEDLGWKEAIYEVLKRADGAMHYAAIADEIAVRELRTDLGATPAGTVASVIAQSLQKEGPASKFVRTERGYYGLREKQQTSPQATPAPEEEAGESTGLVNAFGMFWDRSKVVWESKPSLWGRQPPGSTLVDFCDQKGVYLLHDSQGVVYVGRADQLLGRRLYQHTSDRLDGRWTRFSWFGVYPAEESGSLATSIDFSCVNIETVVATMEAVLIEGLEPRQNRKRGDDFKAIEFLQVEDPQFERRRKQTLLSELAATLGK